MVIVSNKISQKYIATKNLRNTGVMMVFDKEQAQKFPSKAAAIDSLNAWNLNSDEYEIETYYYPSQNSFTLREKDGSKFI